MKDRNSWVIAACMSIAICFGNIRFVAHAEQDVPKITVAAPGNRLRHPFPKQLSRSFLVIGHRGNSSEAPENTLAAIKNTFALGGGMVEIDVHLSRDGVPMVIHDETVDRTTNGKGVVAEMTVAELKRLDAGSWKGPRYAGERIPTLAEVLHVAHGRGKLLLDLKVDGMGRPIGEVFRRLKLSHNMVAVGTQTPEQTNDFVKHLLGALILHNFEAPDTWKSDFFKKQVARGIKGLELGANWSPKFISEAHEHGLPVYAYTINDEPAMRKLIEMGIDGIETDVPAVLLRVANEMRQQPKLK